ncbi:glycosyltransferase [Knoellia flava]|uniref:glycosyltransferase n=2 Tax=Knoellia flava TaxID=913969 RepID=UPI001669D73B|nr:glycosyltransferase [Knoellia flava]
MLPPAASPARQAVRAVVLTAGARPGLRALLDALAASATRPDSVVVLDTSSEEGAAEVVAAASSRTFAVEHVSLDSRMPDRAAVTHWLTTGDVPDDDLVWLLPVGCVPEPGTLGRLLAAHRRSPSVGLVGPKHVDATQPGTLRSVGITTTRSGRVVEDPPLGEPDQGQYDLRRDVIAVPLAGMLASAGALRSLGGWERSFGDLGGDLDLGWRAQLSGHRVVVAPDARLRSVAALGLATATTGARRRAARRVALARAPWWQVPFLALWVLLSSVAAGVGLLLLKRPRAAVAAFADAGSLDPFRVVAARHRTRGGRQLRHRDIDTLFVPASAIVRRSLDRAHEAVIAPSRLPDEHVRDPEASSGLGRLLVHPALLAVLASVAVVVAAGRDIGGGLVSRFGSGVTGGELVTTRATSSTLWHAAFDGWHGAGLGGDGPASPSLALLALPTWVLEQLPGAGDLTSSAGAVVGALLVLALPLAALSAYVSSRVITSSRSRPVRGAVALLWATTGAAGAAVAQGRLGALVALVLLPPVLAGVVMLARPTGTATGAFATSLGAAALGAFAPPLLVLVVLACVGVAVVGDNGARARALVPAVLGPLLLGPWLADVVDDWALAATGPGLSQWGTASTEPLALALLHPGGAGSLPWWVSAVVVAAGLVGLLAPRRVRSVATGAALLGLVSLAAALFAPRLELAPTGLASGLASAPPVTAWSGTFILPLTLALLAMAVVGAETLRGRLRTASTVGFVLVGLATAGALGWFGFGEVLRTWSDERPAVAVEQADNDLANRTLFVDPGTTGAAYRIVGRESSSLARSLPRDLEHDAALADDVAGLLDGTQVSAGPRLAQRAVGFVAVAESAGEDVARRLDSAPGLSRLASRDGYAFWRVAALGASPERAVAPTRLSLVTGTDRAPVATTGEHGATETTVTARDGDLLVVAEPMAWAAHAEVSIDGQVLRPRADTEEPTYAVPAGTHDLVVEVTTEHSWWRLLQGMALAIVGFLAIPFGTRSFRSKR